MSIKNVVFLLSLWLLPIIGSAQKVEFNGEFVLFREAKTKQPVLIVNDSLVYKGFDMKKIAFNHTEYPAKLQEYVFFNIGKKTYLVHEGCGPVLEFRNDSIVRIDNSFLHRNQYGAVRFVYNKEIYFFGGYGMFTFKNILTKYDFATREWIVVSTYSDVPIVTRESAFSYLIKNNLYVFGGNTQEDTRIKSKQQLDNTIWKLHLPTMKWYNSGEINEIPKVNLRSKLLSNNFEKIFLITNEYTIVDPKKNTIEKFDLKLFSTFISNYIEGDSIICVIKNEISKNKYIAILPITFVKGKHISTTAFAKPRLIDYKIILIISIFFSFCCVIFFIFRKRIKNKLKPFNGIVYNQQKELFFYKGKPITIFEEQENRLLHFLLEQNNQFVSLNNLNQLFENKGQIETISATVKRREQAVDGLLTKVSKITGIEEQKLVLERKNSEDKRIKDILLLNNVLKKEI